MSGIERLGITLAFRPLRGFSADAHPAPEYGRRASWAAHPGLDDPSDLLPEGVAPPPVDPPADCFFVHPTTAVRGRRWNAPFDDPHAAGLLDHMLAIEATAFNASCRVFAPRYRQTGLYPMLQSTADGHRAIDLAFADVEAAFDHYLTHHHDNRPIVLAGHSQGSLHVLRLLETRFTGTPLRDHLVAAYAVGCQAPRDKLLRTLRDIPLGDAPDSTGCLMAWDSVDAPPAPSEVGAPHWYPQGYEPPFGKRAICVDPLSWRADGSSGAATSLGAVPYPMADVFQRYWKGKTEPLPAELPAPVPGATSTRSEGNHLIVEPPGDPRISPTHGSYHGYDYPLFFMDIRANVAARVAAFSSRAA